jgi:hypothetical protein
MTPQDPTSASPTLTEPSGPGSAWLSPGINPANSGLTPLTVDQIDSMSPQEIQQHRLAYGLQLLASQPVYRGLLLYPADAYSQEIADLISLEAEFRQSLAPPTLKEGESFVNEAYTTKVRSADYHRQQDAASRHLQEQLESAEATAAEMAKGNLWAVPVANPNATSMGLPSYGLVWGTLPEGMYPSYLSPWFSQDWVTGRKGPVLVLRQDPFPVSPELWQRVRIGAILKGRAYKLEPAKED